MLVRATTRGYFGSLREPGETFEVAHAGQIGRWMEPVGTEASADHAPAEVPAEVPKRPGRPRRSDAS